MLTIIALRLAGLFLLGLFVLNFFVPRRFNWAEELPRLSLINRRIFQVHAVFIAFILLFSGLLLVGLPHELLAPTPLARAVLGGLAAFWGLRLWMQWFMYDRELWRGKRFETAMHLLLHAACGSSSPRRSRGRCGQNVTGRRDARHEQGQRIIIAGGTRLHRAGACAATLAVARLTRSSSSRAQPVESRARRRRPAPVAWDGKTLGEWTREVDGADAVDQPRRQERQLPLHARSALRRSTRRA